MRRAKQSAVQWASLLAGIVLAALPFPLFFIPNDIAPGGISGVATLLRVATGWPVGLMSALINVPLFLVGFRRMGRAFAIKSLIGTLGMSLCIDLLPFGALTSDPILASVFGGVLLGAGLGLVIRSGATTGGTDMLATLIHELLPAFSVGGLLLALDFCVIAASGFVFGVQSALYALIAIFLTSQVIDRVVEGFDASKAFFVFSDRTDEIARAVMDGLSRGATLLHGQGAYSGRERDVLLCVVTRMQVPQFKALVKAVDPAAFVMVTDVHEVLGEGFTRPAGEEGN